MTSRNPVTLVLIAVLAVGSAACQSRPQESPLTNPISPTTPVVEDQPVSVFGTVDGVSGQCPAITISINGIAVKTNTLTVYAGIGGCGAVKTGDAGGVTGLRGSDGTVTAALVSLTTPSPLPLSFTGTITKLSGGCPDLVMTIGLFEVHTRAITGFDGKPCSELKVGDRVTVTGTKTGSDAVIANGVDASAPPPSTTVNVIGSVEKLSGSCPSLTLTVNGTEVRTNASTTFGVSGGCVGIRVGDKGLVAGVKQSDGAVLATFVSLATPK